MYHTQGRADAPLANHPERVVRDRRGGSGRLLVVLAAVQQGHGARAERAVQDEDPVPQPA